MVFSSDDSEDEEEDSLRDQTRSPDSSVPVWPEWNVQGVTGVITSAVFLKDNFYNIDFYGFCL